jgi:sugar/nucleoside kinase (ribokinase family)
VYGVFWPFVMILLRPHRGQWAFITGGPISGGQAIDRLEDLIRNVDVIFVYREQLAALVEQSSARALRSGDALQDQLIAYFRWKAHRRVERPQVIVVKDPIYNETRHVAERFLAVASGGSHLERFFYPRELPRSVEIRAVDTTGAGDAAAAAFLYGMLQGGSMEDCLDASFLLACFASTSVGARSAFQEQDEVSALATSHDTDLPVVEPPAPGRP